MAPAQTNPRQQPTSFGALNRSELMRRVHSKGNATTEGRMMAILRAEGLVGWRRHLSVPGRPDFVWRDRKVALFVDGCFWHGHNCNRNLSPRTNAAFWKAKIERNRLRDRTVAGLLRRQGWVVLRVWECRLKERPLACAARIRKALSLGATQRRAKATASGAKRKPISSPRLLRHSESRRRPFR